VDSATNYPINKRPEDFRLAEIYLQEWINTHGISDLEIMMKIGSVNNMMTPENNLSPSFLLLNADEYAHRFGSNLSHLMIHWDNRDEEEAIADSLSTLFSLQKDGILPGLSGVRHPEVYAKVLKQLDAPKNMPLQIKHNLVYSDYDRVAPLHPWVKCLAYGINGGGIKLDTATYAPKASLTVRGGVPAKHKELTIQLNALINDFSTKYSDAPSPQRMNHLGMLYALGHPGINGVLLGVSNMEQLNDSLNWLEALSTNDYRLLWESLANL